MTLTRVKKRKQKPKPLFVTEREHVRQMIDFHRQFDLLPFHRHFPTNDCNDWLNFTGPLKRWTKFDGTSKKRLTSESWKKTFVKNPRRNEYYPWRSKIPTGQRQGYCLYFFRKLFIFVETASSLSSWHSISNTKSPVEWERVDDNTVSREIFK